MTANCPGCPGCDGTGGEAEAKRRQVEEEAVSRYEAHVDADEAVVPCTRCDGTGYIPLFSHVKDGVCFRCNGTGDEPQEKPQETRREVLTRALARLVAQGQQAPEVERPALRERYRALREELRMLDDGP